MKDAPDPGRAAEASKNAFLANMSHELRTPMNAIIGMTDLVLETNLDAEQRRLLTSARAAADQLMRIINDVLDFSKIESGRLDFEDIAFSLRDCVERAVEVHQEGARRKGLLLDHRVDAAVPDELRGDPHRLRQVLQNLIGNAVKFTDRGHVLVRVWVERVDPWACALRFSIEDSGIGISPDQQAGIFEAFTQADESASRTHGGIGLGLSVASRLVERMGGNLAVASAPGCGSTFEFSARFVRRHDHAEPDGTVALDKLRILLAGENAFENENLAKTLAGWQIRPVFESHGERALAQMRRASSGNAALNVVILGDRLADMDVFEFSRAVREDPAIQPPAIILTASAGQRGDAAQCRAIGIDAYLTRPLQPLDLLDAILLAVSTRRGTRLITRHSLREQRRSLQILLAAAECHEGIANALERLGHVVHQAGSGDEAVESLQAANFDLVVLDGRLDGADGPSVVARMRELERSGARAASVIAMVPAADDRLAAALQAAGADILLHAPPDTIALVTALRRVAQRKRAPGERQAHEGAPQEAAAASFDAGLALDYLGGDEELLDALIDQYLASEADLRLRLDEAIRRADPKSAHAAALAISGSVGSFMAGAALAAAERIERCCREARAVRDIDLARLWTEMDRLARTLRERRAAKS